MHLIDADAVKCEIEKVRDYYNTGTYIPRTIISDLNKIVKSIESSIIVGEWKENTVVRENGETYTAYLLCSNCGRISTFRFPYCPDCGANMKGDINVGR